MCADGWTLLLTSDTAAALDTEGAGHSRSGRLLTLYHARSGRSVSFVAAGGCFRFGVAQVLIVHEEANNFEKESSLSVTAVDLSDIVKYWEAEGVAAVAPGVNNPAAAHYKEPLLLTSLPATLHAQWHLPLVSTDKHAPALAPAVPAESGTQVDLVAAACLDQTSDPHLPALRVVSRTAGAVMDVSLKAFSKALSSPGGVPQQPTASPASEPNSPCAFSNALPHCPVHVWSIGKLVYVLTERGVLHQCGVGAAVPQYVGAACVPLPSVKRALKVDALPPVVKEKEEDFAPTVVTGATLTPAFSVAAPASSATSAGAAPVTQSTTSLPPQSLASNKTATVSPKPVVRNWTDNPGFGLKKPSTAGSPSSSPVSFPADTSANTMPEVAKDEEVEDAVAVGPVSENATSPILVAQAEEKEKGEENEGSTELGLIATEGVQVKTEDGHSITQPSHDDTAAPPQDDESDQNGTQDVEAEVCGVTNTKETSIDAPDVDAAAKDSSSASTAAIEEAEEVVGVTVDDAAAVAGTQTAEMEPSVVSAGEAQGEQESAAVVVAEATPSEAEEPVHETVPVEEGNGSDVSSVVSLEMASSSNEDA